MTSNFACLHGQHRVLVPYRGSNTIKNLIRLIQEGEPEDYVDTRITDLNYPQTREGDDLATIYLISFHPWLSAKDDALSILRARGYTPANSAELLALRASKPRLRFGRRVNALGQECSLRSGSKWVVCLGKGDGPGLKMRTVNSGWAPFWQFAVKKIESE